MGTLVDKNGQPIVKVKNTAPNLDPDFWLTDNDSNATVKNMLAMPYAYHVWVYKCVSAIAQNVSQLTKYLQEKKAGTTKEEHAVLTLLQKPNTVMTQVTFFRMIICQLLLPATKGGVATGGQSFVIPWNTIRDDKVRLDKGEIPNELFPYPETYFEPWYGEESKGRKQLLGWVFRIPQVPGSEIKFEHGEIIRINMLNPYDVLKGLSPFSSIASAVELDAKADVFNSEIFANSGRLDGQVSTDQFVEATELQKVKEEWYRQYTGSNRRRVAFLSGGLKYEQFALSSVDMEYIEQEKWSRQKVLGAYGQNRIGMGDYEDINYATIKEGRKILWYDTYIPTDKLLLDGFNSQWINYLEQGKYQLASDYTKVPALQADMQERAKTGAILVSQMGYPPSLASRIVELPLKTEDIEKWPHLDEQLKASSPAVPNPADAGERAKSIKTKDAREDYSRMYIERSLDPGERFFKRDLDKYFVSQRNRILDNVDEWLSKQKSIKSKGLETVGAWELLTDLIRENLELMKIYKPAVATQVSLEKKQVASELGGISWDFVDTKTQYWANARSVYLEEINTSTFEHARDAIDATIRDGMGRGITPSEMAKEIKQAVHDVYEVRLGKPVVPNGLFDLGGMSSSQTIARTEMGTIASLTRNDIFQAEGIEKIEWVQSNDDKVRDSHRIEEVIRVGETFSNGLRYPRDQQGPPEEVINCRCAFIAVVE